MLSNNEVVVRTAVIPKMVSSGVISPARAISDFHGEVDAEGKKVYTISVGRESMLPDASAIHDYGCRVAAAQNRTFERLNGRPPVRGVETQHYRGSYKLSVGPILQLSSDIFNLVVREVPKEGLDEHCDIEMRRTDREFRRIEVSGERTSVIASLRLFLRDPIEHICDCDLDMMDVLTPIRLVEIEPPAGEMLNGPANA